MAQKLPYLPTPGMASKILDKIIEARIPERFTIDFLSTRLGFTGGSARPIIPLLKRIGFLREDGTPTELYRKFRSESERGAAMAEALRQGYDELFTRNEYAHEMNRTALQDLVYQITGAEKGNTASVCVVATFLALKEYADFDQDESDSNDTNARVPVPINEPTPRPDAESAPARSFGLAYTININLPETTNVEVYNAIFEAIERKLLK